MVHFDAGVGPEFREFLSALAARAEKSGVFEGVVLRAEGMVECLAKNVADEAAYRVEVDDGRVFVGWTSANRWMSQSIEAELKWTGDDLQELIEDECKSCGYDGPAIGAFEHFRSEELLYTFRNHIPMSGRGGSPSGENDVQRALQCLLGYEATFRELGDMRRAAAGDE